MRLIDADTIDDVVQDLNENHNSGITRNEYKRITAVLYEMPTIDAVPVVRCKDCKWSYTDEETLVCGYRGFFVNEAFFCADGERKDDEEQV